jgi:hypothetical protein
MYRPQYAYPLPDPPCEDQPCLYSFDATNCPIFTGTLAAGAQTGRVPLKLDKDADFFLRAFDSQGLVSIRIEDPNGNPLSDSGNSNDPTNFELPKEYSQTAGAGFVALEGGKEGLFAPAGANFLAYLYNAGTASIDLTTCALNLAGVKRYSKEVCAA